MAAPSSVLLAKLNDAEKQADTIIEEAKKNRKALLNKARQAAQEELQGFSARQEAEYQAIISAKDHGDATEALTAQTTRELSEVEDDFARHKAETVSYVVEKVLDVPLKMSSTQRQALVAEAAEGEKPAAKPAAAPTGPAPIPAPAPAPAPAPVSEAKTEPTPQAQPLRKDSTQQAAEATQQVADHDPLRLAGEAIPAAARSGSWAGDADDGEDEGPAGGWGGNSFTITLKSIKAQVGDKKMDTFVEIKYAGRGMRSQVIKNGGRDAVFDEELPPLPMQPDAELVFSVGDFDKSKDGTATKEPIGDTKPIKLEELKTGDGGVFEGSLELFREGRAKSTGKLFVKIAID